MLMRYTGKTFSCLITELQMEKAKQMLEETSMSITEVSTAVGCYDSSHFTRKFKKTFGMTPYAYRKKQNRCVNNLFLYVSTGQRVNTLKFCTLQ